MKNFAKRHLAACIIGCAGVAFFSWYVIGNFTSYYFNAEGVQWDALCAMFRSNYHFLPVPHLDLSGDCLLYPYGIDITFVPWWFGHHYSQLFCRLLTGGLYPTQWFYVYSLLVTFFGVYALVCRRKGPFWGCFFAFALTFCNYAAICKFPGHNQLCHVHWLAISFVLDLILVEKFWNRERFSAQFFQCRVLVWCLCLGMELGYVAGLALTVSLFSLAYTGIVLLLRERSASGCWRFVKEALHDFFETYRASLFCNVVLTLLVLAAAWLFLPLAVQISMHASVMTEKTQIWRTHPFRLFLPIFPGLNPATVPNQGRFAEVDTVYAWNAGWFFLLVFILALLKGWLKGLKRSFPFVLLFALFLLFYHFPVLSCLPMLKCSRIAERFSPGVILFLIAPLYFCVSRFSASACRTFVRQKWESLLLLGGLFALEFVTAYASALPWARDLPLVDFPKDYCAAVEKVSKMPGEAIFFLPFSAHGGNGKGMGRYHLLTAHQMQFAAKCGKKLNGCYLGRMLPELYLKEFDRFDWPSYLESDHAWPKQKWQAFETFLANSDFCALIVARNQLPEAIVSDVMAHLGAPACEFKIFSETYAVIPVPAHLRGRKPGMR